MTALLQLLYSPTPLRPAAAWFIVGPEPQAWLAELVSWHAPLAEARLHVVPESGGGSRPCGLLVLGASPADAVGTPRALPYGQIAGRLYLPIDARLDPAVQDRELNELLGTDDASFVWHPQSGLVALPHQKARRLCDFLAAAPSAGETWDTAVRGLALNGRLLSIEPDRPPGVSEVLDEGRADIGARSNELDALPAGPDETAPGALGEVGRAFQTGLARAVRWLTGQVPHTGSTRTWVNNLEDWANRRMAQASASLDAARHRELSRLLHLLRTNPEEGMRFALPLGGSAHRGQAPPSDRLARRDVDFRLDQLGGGQPADLWDVPSKYRLEITARYRELAAREIALGRHRRAAYIFATLLDDLKSAASVLADGRHWREAAVLYEQRLQQPLEAARCLRQGGFWAEAVALYQRLEQHEIVGDLHQQLDELEEASAAWRRAVDRHLAGHDHLAAARILELKLARPDEACQRLLEAWPETSQAARSLGEAFQLLARQGWHERAASLVADLPARIVPAKMNSALARVLSAQAIAYPDSHVRGRAADQTRVFVAGKLAVADGDDAEEMLDAVRRLAPDDRLLRRDTQRYAEERRKRLAPAPSQGRLTRASQLKAEFQLPAADWQTATTTDDALFAAGYRDREVVFVRLGWRGGKVDQPQGKPDLVLPSHPILLAADPLGRSPLLAHVCYQTAHLAPRHFAASDVFAPLAVGSHPGISARTMAMMYTGRETFHAVDYQNDHVLLISSYSSLSAHLLSQFAVDLKPLMPAAGRWTDVLPFLVRKEIALLGVGNRLCFSRPVGDTQSLELPAAIRKIIGSEPLTRARIAVALERGAVLLFAVHWHAEPVRFAKEMPEPQIALTRGGWLIAGSQDEIEIHSTRDGKLQFQGRSRHQAGSLLAVVGTHDPHQFALVARNGRIEVYDIRG
jgi:tetratricopeptide (TPR) repeat protein